MSGGEKKKFSVGDVIRRLDENGGDRQASDTPQSAPRPHDPSPDSAHRPSPPPLTDTSPMTAAPRTKPRHPETVAAAYEDEDEEAFDLLQYLSVIIRRRNVIILVVLLATAYAIYAYLTAPRYYEAHARLLFSPGYQEIGAGDYSAYRQWVSRERLFRTHLELLRSRAVLSLLSENLDNRVLPPEIAAGMTIKRGMTAGEENDIIEIAYQHPDAELAKDVANELCRTYIDYVRDVNAQEQTRLILKLETQIGKLRAELKEKEDAFRAFKVEHRMVHLSDETSASVAQVSGMEVALQQTQLELVETKQRLKALRSNISQQDVSIVQSMTYDNAYQNRLSDLELQLNTLSAEYSPEHFKVRMLREQIDTLRRAMESDIQSRVARQTTYVKNPVRQSLLQELVQLTISKSALETRRTAQEQLVESLSTDLVQLPALEQQYVSLQRETTLLTETLKMLQREYEQAKIKRDSQESDLRIFELAPTPKALISELQPTSIVIGILVGLLLGIVLAFLLEYLDQTVKDPADIEKLTESHLLGFVPFIDGGRPMIDTRDKSASEVVEPFRAVRANLKHTIDQQHYRSLLVCSALKGEGKTTLVANLALAFSLDGRRVILIDCDLRRPQLHRFFGLSREPGLSEYLTDACSLEEALRESSREGVLVITSGAAPHNRAELLGTQRFSSLLDRLRTQADLVLLDTPPLLPVSDVITIAPNVEAAVMVVRTLWTPKKAARQTAAHLRRIGLDIVGAVANGVSHGKGYYAYYYGYYSRRYGYYEHEPPKPWWSPSGLAQRVRGSVRERLSELCFAVPRLVAMSGSHVRGLVRRPLFWVLALALASLLVVERRLAMRHTGSHGDIEQLGELSDGGLSNEMSADDIAFDLLPAPRVAGTRRELPDALRRWTEALQAGDGRGLLAFYDTGRFEWHEGDSTRGGSGALRHLLSTFGADGILVDSVSIASESAPVCTTLAFLQLPGRVLSTRVSTVWHRDNDVWRIVAHTLESGETHERTR
ncbi:MAG: polysaccharide biosynthesis tyrosine autokinase [Chitinivibrionales bacterium]|nr:polysaccharide biosynthesis tyrosine autokinase [Chitinivibrionales bacterium]